MQLPFSEELNIGCLSIMLRVDRDHNRFTFSELIDEMIADAWYMVTEYHLRLGPLGVTDNLEDVVKYISRKYPLRPSERREKILEFLKDTEDKTILKYKRDLTLNVPYRLQVPFYDAIEIDRKTWYGPKDELTARINLQKRLMYYFIRVQGLETVIEVDPLWCVYLEKHREILFGWTRLKLILYLQNKNPSVPGIAEKIEAPAVRDIERVRRYWKLIVTLDPSLRDIYGDVDLRDEVISVDHFVPWQYVAHDELWNLHPTTRSINSSKSNLLPKWEQYFDKLGELEYRAYAMRGSCESVAREFEKCALYHLNNQEIRDRLYVPGLTAPEFKGRLEQVIRPVYDSAMNCGFREWSYDR